MHNDEFLDVLALHALELLDERTAAEVEDHLKDGCAMCTGHLKDFRNAFASIAQAGRVAVPPPELRERILVKLTKGGGAQETRVTSEGGAQAWKAWTPTADVSGFYVVRSSHDEWEKVHDGVWAKRLYVDRDRDVVTMLIRMEPGASWIPHRHGGPEQCYVLAGDLREGDLVVRAGDFQYAAEGSLHGAQRTDGGCMLLIVSSLRDELLR